MPLLSITQTIADFVTNTIGDYGLFAVFFLMLLESACIPVPSEVIMLFAGFLVSQGEMGLVAAVLAGAIGNLVGSLIAYGVGYWGGRPFIDRYGKYVHVTPKRMDMAERWFDKRGNAVVFWSRMLPVIRTFISLPAGVARMPIGRFSLYTFLGALPWCLLLTLIGRAVGDRWEELHAYLRILDFMVVAAIAAGIIYIIVKRRGGGSEEATEEAAA